MKVSKVEKKEYEVIIVDGIEFYRISESHWTPINNNGCDYLIKDLEAAYQRFKNPPFEIDHTLNDANIRLTIGNKVFFVHNYLNADKDLEQALNSLLEDK